MKTFQQLSANNQETAISYFMSNILDVIQMSEISPFNDAAINAAIATIKAAYPDPVTLRNELYTQLYQPILQKATIAAEAALYPVDELIGPTIDYLEDIPQDTVIGY